MTEIILDAGQAGQRLDKVLSLVLALGLRTCRRLLTEDKVLVNGCKRPAAWRLHSGDCLHILAPAPLAHPAEENLPRLVAQTASYLAFLKPSGLHTVHLNGSEHRALTDFLPHLTGLPTEQIILLQRLDFLTSGLVCATTSEVAARAFREAERQGQYYKFYLALLHGRLHAEQEARWLLQTHNRKKVRRLAQDAPPLRRTVFYPLHIYEQGTFCSSIAETLTLALCLLHCGVRHQIRAHAAALGHPLLGDSLYGSPNVQNKFFLHHTALFGPDLAFCSFPNWLDAQTQNEVWLKCCKSKFSSFFCTVAKAASNCSTCETKAS